MVQSFYVYPPDDSAPDLVHADHYVLDGEWFLFFLDDVIIDRIRVWSVKRIRNLSAQPCLTTAEVPDDAC